MYGTLMYSFCRSSLQWNSPSEKRLTGGNNFSGINPAPATWNQQQPMMVRAMLIAVSLCGFSVIAFSLSKMLSAQLGISVI